MLSSVVDHSLSYLDKLTKKQLQLAIMLILILVAFASVLYVISIKAIEDSESSIKLDIKELQTAVIAANAKQDERIELLTRITNQQMVSDGKQDTMLEYMQRSIDQLRPHARKEIHQESTETSFTGHKVHDIQDLLQTMQPRG